MDYNRIVVTGRLTKDPELTALQNGTMIMKTGVACSRYKKPGDENAVVDFFNVVAYGKTAEAIAQYRKKGELTLFEGKMQSRS